MIHIKFDKTCDACPEQYDAYFENEQVGYLRLRHGYFQVRYPNSSGITIYEANTKGDGIFEPDEREIHMDAARRAIINKLFEEETDKHED